ncbi:MAG TPA: phosphate signaling complex protein PhoU [Candidatus Lustribacter sp.]|nr:phosphate signaling complex protein PhoU [Candidatus Lustribacter sp.]
MRDAFHDELALITDQLVELTRLAGSAISRATTALLDADLALADSVILADEQIDEIRQLLDELSIEILARQQPVATDLRTVVTSMRMSSDLERMGDLARHVAKIARLRYPESAVPPAMRASVVQMGQVATRIVAKTGSIIAARDVKAAQTLDGDDDEMDTLHRELIASMLSGSWPYGTETAVDMTLIGRYYERFADHAVSIANRVVYLVTGSYTHDQTDHDEPGHAGVSV